MRALALALLLAAPAQLAGRSFVAIGFHERVRSFKIFCEAT